VVYIAAIGRLTAGSIGKRQTLDRAEAADATSIAAR
jgi:hypothetical protein